MKLVTITICLAVSFSKKFSYSIMLQSRLNVLRRGMVTRYSTLPGIKQLIDMDQDLDSTTDFWGKYALIKKL